MSPDLSSADAPIAVTSALDLNRNSQKRPQSGDPDELTSENTSQKKSRRAENAEAAENMDFVHVLTRIICGHDLDTLRSRLAVVEAQRDQTVAQRNLLQAQLRDSKARIAALNMVVEDIAPQAIQQISSASSIADFRRDSGSRSITSAASAGLSTELGSKSSHSNFPLCKVGLMVWS